MSRRTADLAFAVSGMTCASCVRRVARALERVPGVGEASVNLATERATIEPSDRTPDPGALIAAIERAGYRASLVTDDDAAANADEVRRGAELAYRRRILALAVGLFVPTLVVAMALPAFALRNAVLFALALPVYAIAGYPFHRSALASARAGAANMDTLVSLGSTAAFAYSLYATVARVPTYFETASAIVTLISIGKYLEARAKTSSGAALRELLALRPARARVRGDDGAIVEMTIDHVRPGDTIEIRAGDRIAIDGRVVAGHSAVDVSMLTGEPLPRDVAPGDEVAAGTLNGDGTLLVRATAVGGGTTLARIVAIVARAQGSTPPVQRLADRVAGVFVPTILVLAALTFVRWVATGHPWHVALVVAVAVLVIACPCALGLATPLAIMVGVGTGARAGLLVRDAEALERLATVDRVIFDKTGTLTAGRPEVTRVLAAPGRAERDVVQLAAAVERTSGHPLARAIVRAAAGDAPGAPPDAPVARDATAARGGGMRATVDGVPARVGSAAFVGAAAAHAAFAVSPDATVAYVATPAGVIGAIEFADRMRPESAAAVAALRALGIAVEIVSGDAAGPVTHVARALGVADAAAETSPEGKADLVASRAAAGSRIAFVGDGINDAPALARANVGVAMGGGADIALETAGVALLRGDPRDVATAIRLARATRRIVAQNLFWAVAYNLALVPLAMAGRVDPAYAAAAMGLSSLFVAGNSLRLRRTHV